MVRQSGFAAGDSSDILVLQVYTFFLAVYKTNGFAAGDSSDRLVLQVYTLFLALYKTSGSAAADSLKFWSCRCTRFSWRCTRPVGLQLLTVQHSSVLAGVYVFPGGVQDQRGGGCGRLRPPGAGAVGDRGAPAAAAEPRAEPPDALVRALLWRAGQGLRRGGVGHHGRSLYRIHLNLLGSVRRSQ